ncbi:sensor histidine kinase [Planctomicrobium sp. SH527]|uniref:sensor histidine kinase n=1 Tax=Planctomicrobium sp. SH527 TaxID=3448123 RepID=UPI003F5BA892
MSFLALAFCLLISDTAFALAPDRFLTQAFLRKWQAPQGLPRASILSLHQTQDGILLLGTQAGLHQFDGLKFQHLNAVNGPSLENVWISDIQQSNDKAIWLATNGSGVFRYHDSDTEVVGANARLDLLNVHHLFLDSRDHLWIGTDDGVYVLDTTVRTSTGWNVEKVGSAQGLPLTNILACTQTEDDAVWVGGTGNILYRESENTFSAVSMKSIPDTAIVTTLLADGQAIWVGSSHGLVRVEGDQETLYSKENGLPHEWIECLTSSPDGSLWIGTKDGICRLRNGGMDLFRTRDGLSQSTACSILEDHEGSLWVGTKNGLNQFVDRRTVPLTVSEGLGSNEAGPILEDSNRNIWLGTLDAGLALVEGQSCKTLFTTQNGLPSNKILSLERDEQGSVWIGTDRGLCLMQDKKIIDLWDIEKGLPSNIIQALCMDKNGVLWIGTNKGIVFRKDGEIHTPENATGREAHSILDLLANDVEGVIASAETGVFLCKESGMVQILQSYSALQGVDSIIRSVDGLYWMGTRDRGLFVVDSLDGKGLVFQFTMKQGLYDDEIFGVVAEPDDRLWLACSRGIFYVSREELLKCARGEIQRIVSSPFSPTESQKTVECQRGVQPCAVISENNLLWFSTNQGVLSASPQRLSRTLPKPNVIIEEMQANGDRVDLGQPVRLPAGRANVSFRYTAATYVVPQRVRFRYMLEGFDEDWIDVGERREAFYTNLPPRHYRFRVSATNQTLNWSEIAAPIEFVVPPHFYETRWFKIGSLFLAGFVFWGIYRLRVLQIRSRLMAVMAERLRIARELHDTLIQGFSGVTMQMQALSNRLQPSLEQKTLKEVISDAGFCLREARRTVAGLRSTSGAASLPDAVTQAATQAAETHGLQLKLNIEELSRQLPMEVEYHLLRIAQEAISNTVRHADAKHLHVTLTFRSGRIRLVIKDDGRGFQVAGAEGRLPGHYGLIGMRERAIQIHGILELQSSPSGGTTVQIDVPIPPQPSETTPWYSSRSV